MSKRLIIIGAGGHGRSVAEVISLLPAWNFVGFVDDGASRTKDERLLGATERLRELRESVDCAVVAIGNNAVREQFVHRLRELHFELPTIVHPQAVVSPSAHMAAGCAVMAGAVIGTEARVGEGVIVNAAAVVDHHCVVEDFGHLGVNACMAGGSVLGRSAWMQAGSALGYGVRVMPREVLNVGESRQHG